MVLLIIQHDLPEPRTDFGHAIMHPALKLSLDGFELRDHSLLRSDPPYGKGSALVALPTVVGKAQEGEGLWFSLSPLSGRERRTARTRSVGSCPDVIPSRTILPKSGSATNQPATPQQIEHIRQRLGTELDAGALAVGMGIEYTPGATRLEVIDMFRLAAERGVPVFTHARSSVRPSRAPRSNGQRSDWRGCYFGRFAAHRAH